MKKIFRTTYLALLLIACLSCNNDPMPDAPKGKYPILFRCSDETRAVATVDSMQEDENGFDVYAYITTDTQPVNNVSFDKIVKWDKSQLMWLYKDIEYWIVGATYWFKAVYPAMDSIKQIAENATVDNDDSNQTVTISGYDITSQKDILVATTGALVVDENGAPNGGPTMVSLNFQHLLANVTIKAKSEIDGVTIQKIVIGHADTNSTYNGSAWDLSGNTTSIVYSQSTPLTKGAEFVDVTEGGILVIPASANNKTLTIQANKTYQLEFPNGTWEPGKRYTYTLEIKQDDIIFVDDAPYVEEWDSENATGSVIIK